MRESNEGKVLNVCVSILMSMCVLCKEKVK